MKRASILLTSAALLLTIGACTVVTPSGTTTGTATAVGGQTNADQGGVNNANHQWGAPTKTSGCQAANALQDSACTPGDILPDATREMICVPGYSKTVRNVTTSTKNKVYANYGITSHVAGEYEIDHLVSLELGGSNDISNLWPEAAEPRPGFHEKDKVENWLHDQVCSGAIALKDAQVQIATNWLDIYQRMPADKK
ncbi:MAG: HNH endonuclease [Chloroflexi bacterium]|nr:HNH endonuclease [Chloroflexota bacterium]MCL5273635.1 HNH endonuclease [Chloroflexota bacterium]